MMGQPRVSIVVCAYTMERWNDLDEAMVSLQSQSRRPDEIMLVIDHNHELLERARAHFPPPVRVVPNAGPRGLSGARNTGISASHGELIGFFDDDAVAAPEWLECLLAHCVAPDVLGVVCQVVPRWIGMRPRWFPDEYMWTVGCSYRGLPQGVAEVRNLMGGSALIKRVAFERAGAFASLLGRKGRSLLSCEDTEWCIRARHAFPDHRFLIAPTARMEHKVPASRLTWAYFRRRCYAEGRSKAVVERLAAGKGTLRTERDYVLRILTSGVLRGLADATLRADPSGFSRAAAIVLGFGMATIGYVIGRIDPPTGSTGVPGVALDEASS